MEAVGTILNVVYEILKAAETARQNRKRCLDLADRARAVGNILCEDHDFTTSRTMLTRMPPLERLKASLDEALELIESQRRFGLALGIPSWTAAKFQDVETRITACVVDLGLAEVMAARRPCQCHHANAEATPVHEPPPRQLEASLPSYLAQSAPPPECLFNQYVEQQGKHAQSFNQYMDQQGKHEQSAPRRVSLFDRYMDMEQQGKHAQSLLQGNLTQSAPPRVSLFDQYMDMEQQGKHAQSLLQGNLRQSAPPRVSLFGQYMAMEQQGKHAQSLLQGYLRM